MKKGTETTLIVDLETKSIGPGVAEIIRRAKNGDYSDFRSTMPAPKINLFRDLKLVGLDDIAEKSMAGDYDELI